MEVNGYRQLFGHQHFSKQQNETHIDLEQLNDDNFFFFGVNYPFNCWIQVVQSDLSPQVYKIKHLAMQSAFTYICEKIGILKSSVNSGIGIVTWCHLCNKSVCEISSLLDSVHFGLI